jgi:hypothetical protein
MPVVVLERAVVPWSANVEQAKKAAGGKMIAVYFVQTDLEKVIGGGKAAADEYTKTTRRAAPYTVFDDPKALKEFQESGVGAFVKLAPTKENEEAYRQYGITSTGKLVLCNAEGKGLSVLCGSQGKDAIVRTIKQLMNAAKPAAVSAQGKS